MNDETENFCRGDDQGDTRSSVEVRSDEFDGSLVGCDDSETFDCRTDEVEDCEDEVYRFEVAREVAIVVVAPSKYCCSSDDTVDCSKQRT